MPLSEYEQRVLDQLEAQLTSEDPALGSRLAAASAPRSGRIALGVGGVVLGLSGLVLGIVVGQLWVSMLGFGLMFAGAYFAFSAPKTKGLNAPGPAPRNRKARKPGLSERFEKRFEDGSGPI